MNIITAPITQFVKNNPETLINSFIECLHNFQEDIVNKDKYNLLKVPKDYWKKYFKQLKNGSKEDEKIGIMNYIAYIKNEKEEIKAFICWKKIILGQGVPFHDWIKQNVVEIFELYVSPEYRGNWIGETLINYVESYHENDNIDKFMIEVLYDNEPAKKLYEKKGFKPWHVTMVKEA